ncbi:unnamed protein product [Adineta steineri]|uniref:Siah interacting protein N-terminal domain-containing protein n=1 Tax=Adineta steineri TaxID=433720 RepID=A0A819VHF4_9BILA|nr:unnamed protein product [Adineta steineri]
MTLDEQIQEVTTDIDEVKRLIDQTNRPRIKQNLELQQQKFEKELIQLQEKLQKQQQQATDEAASNITASARTQLYTKDISVYAWDQTDKFIKVYVQNLDGVGNLPENQIQCSFEKRPLPKLDNTKDSNESFMNMVEEMYEKGDDDTKRAIAKAWVQSKEKAHAAATTTNNQNDESMDSGIIKTPEFTFYPPPKK